MVLRTINDDNDVRLDKLDTSIEDFKVYVNDKINDAEKSLDDMKNGLKKINLL